VSAYIHKEKELQCCTLNIYYEITKKFKSQRNQRNLSYTTPKVLYKATRHSNHSNHQEILQHLDSRRTINTSNTWNLEHEHCATAWNLDLESRETAGEWRAAWEGAEQRSRGGCTAAGVGGRRGAASRCRGWRHRGSLFFSSSTRVSAFLFSSSCTLAHALFSHARPSRRRFWCHGDNKAVQGDAIFYDQILPALGRQGIALKT
jgi:hypothetical protein